MRMMYEAVMEDNGLAMVQLWNIPILYLYLQLARATMLVVFLPVLKRTGYGVNWKEIVLLIWGVRDRGEPFTSSILLHDPLSNMTCDTATLGTVVFVTVCQGTITFMLISIRFF